ncbi:MAG: hypothetical protein K0S12_1989, partial [Bacteroidetes bacterium]|nr:hypothetical protein [Bacteroidota bacterium]
DDFVIVFSISVFRDLGDAGDLLLFRIIIVEQGNNRFRTFNEKPGIQTFVEVIFHVLHFPMFIFAQPFFETWRFLLQKFGFADAAKIESESFCFRLDYRRIVMAIGFHVAKVKNEKRFVA